MVAPVAASLGNLQQQVPLRHYTTWKVGGPAEWLAEPASLAELQAQVSWAHNQGLPLRCLGAGSNLLVADQGLAGLSLCLRRLQGSSLDASSGVVEADAGEPIPSLARKAARLGLSGLEWAVGIPGTVGGAAVMNAGAQGGCLAEWLELVRVIDPQQPHRLLDLTPAELDYGYRHSRLQEEAWIVVGIRLRLSSGHDPALISQRTSANLHSRTSSQPYQQPSCGSVFRNPEPRKAGQLIEALGLKGLRLGDAQVSPVHANFIVNLGAATAADVAALINRVQNQVQQAHGLVLQPEVKRLGF
jgi:UDP-N-acetylmuramate dehydrogenase